MTRVILAIALATAVPSAAPLADEPRAVWKAPDDADRRENPLRGQPALAAGGRKVFEQRCASCHGADGRGSDKAPDLTVAPVQTQTDGALFWKISHGNIRHGMPTFSFLPVPQRWQLVLHLRILGER